MITPTEIKQNEQIRTYIEKADEALAALGYTEHSYAHVTRVAHFAEKTTWAIPGACRSWRGSPGICMTSATSLTASTTPRAAR